MANVTNKDIAQVIWDLGKEKKGPQLADFSKKVANFMLRRRLLGQSKKIFAAIESISNHEQGIVKAKVTSTLPLSNALKSKLEDFISDKYKAKQVVFEEKIVPQVLGGFKVEVGDEVIDTTIIRKLKKLQVELSR